MMPEDQIRRTLELANSYDPPAVRAANQGLSVYRRLEPQLQELQRIARQSLEAADHPRYLLIRTFTFARGGWHVAPFLELPAGQFRSIVNELMDKPDEKVKRELDAEIPTYFRHNDHTALQDMISRWTLFPERRRRIFEDAFEAHKCGKYTLSVSALAPQIEGILRDETREYKQDARYMQKINEALDFRYSRGTPPAPPSVEKL